MQEICYLLFEAENFPSAEQWDVCKDRIMEPEAASMGRTEPDLIRHKRAFLEERQRLVRFAEWS